MQYTEIFKLVKMKIFSRKKIDIFLIFAQNIDCGYTLECNARNEYPQSMFWSKNKKNRYTLQLQYNAPHYNAVFNITRPCYGSQIYYFAIYIYSK